MADVRRGLPSPAAALALLAVVVALVVGGVWWLRSPETPDGGARSEAPPSSSRSGPASPSALPAEPTVLVISVDGLGSAWVTEETTPTLAELFATGAGTRNARTEHELTVTLPNHTGMVTGRRVDATRGGHGVTWNDTDPRSVQPGTESVFSTIEDAGGSSAVFSGKEKFEMWARAWPDAIDRLTIDEDQTRLVKEAVADLSAEDRELTFLHLAGPDAAGHDHGWGSPSYVEAVRAADGDIASLLDAIEGDADLAGDTIVVVTADHGGPPEESSHGDPTRAENYTIPFVVWGPGIAAADLYRLNPDRRDPGTRRPGYDGPQPVRNGDVANLVTGLLGLAPVPGSEIGARDGLTVTDPG